MKLHKIIGCAAVSALLLVLFAFNAFGRFEYQARDRLYRDFGLADPDIFVFGIDEVTLTGFGPFQFWPRSLMADAINILNSDPERKPAVIAVDIMYSGSSNDPESDEALVRAAEEGGNVVFGAMVSFDSRGDVNTFEKPFEALERVSSYGIINSITDPDGIVRRTELGMKLFGRNELTFPEAIYKMYTGEYAELPRGMRNPLHLVFTGEPGDYYGALGLGTSFADIFSPDFDPAFFAGAIVMIGPYAAGLMDSYFTAADYRSQMHGVEIHANIVQMFLEENFIGFARPWVNWTVLALTLAVFSFVFMRLDIRISFAALVVFAAGYVFLNKAVFNSGWIITLIYPPVSAGALFCFALVYNYISDKIAHITEIARINAKHLTEVKELFDSFVRVMTAAIDERTPYNANHTVKVADYTQKFVVYLRGLFKPGSPYYMDENREEQIVMAAFLHDVGKITTPTEIMDKESRLGGKLPAVMLRFDIKTQYDKVMLLSGNITKDEYEAQVEYLNDTKTFTERINTAGFLPDEDLERVKTLAEITYKDADGNVVRVFDDSDVENLSVRKGTLTDAERDIMQEHVSVTERLLDKMTFSDRYEHVAGWAKSHHEYIDGSGYPYKMANEQVAPEVRILAMMDIYDALTADDRPYKRATPHHIAVKILRSMVGEGKLDGELVELFIASGIAGEPVPAG
jgi:HD-GYP domain-containing protein (c-di-GMP phosphodiesterase class II)